MRGGHRPSGGAPCYDVYEEVIQMRSSFRWFAFCVFLTLLAVAPALAAGTSSAVVAPTAQLAPATLDASLQLQPVHIASVPSYTASTEALLSAGTQPLGLQTIRGIDNSRHVRWTIIGALAGLAVGVINGDNKLNDTLIGAGIGLGLSFIVAR